MATVTEDAPRAVVRIGGTTRLASYAQSVKVHECYRLLRDRPEVTAVRVLPGGGYGWAATDALVLGMRGDFPAQGFVVTAAGDAVTV